MKFRHLVMLAAFLSLTRLHGVSQSTAAVTETTVCEVAADPGRFAGKLVRFEAQFESDGIERSVLTDSKCKDVGIAPFSPKHFKGEAALKKALGRGRPGTLDKTLTGTFSGIFKWKAESNPKRHRRVDRSYSSVGRDEVAPMSTWGGRSVPQG